MNAIKFEFQDQQLSHVRSTIDFSRFLMLGHVCLPCFSQRRRQQDDDTRKVDKTKTNQNITSGCYRHNIATVNSQHNNRHLITLIKEKSF